MSCEFIRMERREESHINGVKDNGWCPALKRKVIPLGNGWGVIPVSFVIIFKSEGETWEFPLEKYFRKHIGNITKKRIKVIDELAPRQFELSEEGTLKEEDLFNWSERVLVTLKLKRKC